MKILITGGAGFIGSNIVRHLIEQDEFSADVTILDDLSTGTVDNISNYLKDVNFVEGSILDPDLLKKLFKDVEVVFHLAARVSVEDSFQKPLESERINVEGTLNVLESARLCGVNKLIFSSSAAVYGLNESLPISENASINPISPYALQKYAAERYCVFYKKRYGLDTIALRYFNVYGPNQKESGGYAGVVYKFISDGICRSHIIIEGDGLQTRDFIYIDDVAYANLLAMDLKPKAGERVYNIGTGVETSIKKLCEEVERSIDKRVDVEYVGPREGDVRRSCADIRSARDDMNFIPGFSLLEGLSKTTEWIRTRL